jgi:hypothetical protein
LQCPIHVLPDGLLWFLLHCEVEEEFDDYVELLRSSECDSIDSVQSRAQMTDDQESRSNSSALEGCLCQWYQASEAEAPDPQRSSYSLFGEKVAFSSSPLLYLLLSSQALQNSERDDLEEAQCCASKVCAQAFPVAVAVIQG